MPQRLNKKQKLLRIYFLGIMLMYLSCIQIFLSMLIYLVPLSNAATIISSAFLTAFFLASGYILHYRDFTIYIDWLQYVSPTSWVLPYLLNRELTHEAIESSSTIKLCRSKQVLIFSATAPLFLLTNILTGTTSRHYSFAKMWDTKWNSGFVQLWILSVSECILWLWQSGDCNDCFLYRLFYYYHFWFCAVLPERQLV